MATNNIQAKLIVVFKDSLMGTPSGLNYQILVEGEVLQDDIVTSFDNEKVVFIFKENQTDKSKIIISSNGLQKIIDRKNSYQIIIMIVDSQTKVKSIIYSGNLAEKKSLTITAVSPWTKIPLGESVKKDFSSDGDFFEVQYEQKYETKENPEEVNISKTVKVMIKDIPRKIVLTALKHRWSTLWAADARKTSELNKKLNKTVTFDIETNKCNLFVNDVLTEVGINVPWTEHGHALGIKHFLGYDGFGPPLAGEWGEASKFTEDWSASNTPFPGDVGAYAHDYGDATGHVGIIVTNGVTVSAGSDQIEVNDAGFRNKNGTAHRNDHDFTIFRRYKHKVIQ